MRACCAILLALLPLASANAEPRHPATVAWPDAVTACLNHGVFLNERQLISLGDEAVDLGPDAVRELFRERALPVVENPDPLREADRIGPDLFIIAEEHHHFSDIIREMRLPLDEDRRVAVRVRARAERFASVRRAWSVSASSTASEPLTVTLVNRNNTIEQEGETPLDLKPTFALSDQGEIRFTHESGKSTAIPTTLFLKALQRARKLCDS
jgi:hypothetical protein